MSKSLHVGAGMIKNIKMLGILATFGMVFCLFITYQEIFILKVICPVCLTCQLVMFTVFLLAIYLNINPKKHK